MQSTKKAQIEKLVLKTAVLDKIKNDGDLFIQVAKALNISHFTLPDLLRRNDQKLAQASVVRLLKNSIGTNDENEILEHLAVTA